MKKYLIFTAIALLAFASCSKFAEERTADRAISFQVANFAQTKATADYKEGYKDVSFGAYAWYKGVSASDNTTFMTNQKVSYKAADNTWVPDGTTYYWPKSGSLDFICYSPYAEGTDKVSIAEDKVSFSGYTVGTYDLMYGDKVTGINDNKTTYYYNGVPVLFHHALARVAFQVKAAYVEKEADTKDKTKWEVTVNSAKVEGVYTTGDLSLTLDGKAWKLPANKVWKADASKKKDLTFDTKGLKVLTLEPQALGTPAFVLPQLLSGGQKVVLNVTIVTYRDKGDGYVPVLTEKDVELAAPLSAGKLPQWGINQDIVYTFVIAPSRSQVDPSDPEEKPEPIVITFDPAVADWQKVEVNAQINI